jgi:hypothetical protein
MEDNDKLAELAESVMILREDVKRADDTLAGVRDVVGNLLLGAGTQSHTSDRIRSRVIDIDGKVAKHDERFDRIDETLRRILDKLGGDA